MSSMKMTYEDYLDLVIDDLFAVAYRRRWTWAKLAEEAGLSTSTIYRLGEGLTKRPQLRTAFLIAQALNVNLPAVVTRTRNVKRAA